MGLGADLGRDLSDFDEDMLNRLFYLNPVNIGGKSELLHNHAALCSELPMPERPVDLEREIADVIANSDFRDMRHLLDSSTVTSALLGIGYVAHIGADMRADPDQQAGPALSDEVRRKLAAYGRGIT